MQKADLRRLQAGVRYQPGNCLGTDVHSRFAPQGWCPAQGVTCAILNQEVVPTYSAVVSIAQVTGSLCFSAELHQGITCNPPAQPPVCEGLAPGDHTNAETLDYGRQAFMACERKGRLTVAAVLIVAIGRVCE